MKFFKEIISKIKELPVEIFLFIAVIFVVIFSATTLTTKPAVWYDEGINIELARNFSEFGKLDLIVEPMTFSGRGANIGSTGYPITIPLAIFFKVVGFGIAQARIYMLFWMVFFVFSLFYFVKKEWSSHIAILVVLMVVTFAPFYGNGRSVMGEIPGFTFILLTLIWYLHKKNIFGAGIFLGLAVISKPSVYIYFIPVFLILFLLNRKNFLNNIFRLGIGSFVSFFVWLLIYLDVVFSLQTWQRLIAHFSNPYRQEGLSSLINIKNNLASFFDSATLIYFTFFILIITLAIYFRREHYKTHRNFFLIFIFYLPFSVFHYFKSLGYLRYLIASQFLIFILLVPSTFVIINRFLPRQYIRTVKIFCFLILISVQTFHLFTGAKLFYSAKPQKTVQYVEENYNDKTIGIINVPPIASLISPKKKFQYLLTYGIDIGKNPLFMNDNKLPGVIIVSKDYQDKNGDNIINKFYKLVKIIDDDIMIYQKYR